MNKLLFLDVETTGVNENNGIIQISGIIVYETQNATGYELEIKEKFNFRLKPFPEDIIEDKALEINGITREQLSSYPEPLQIFKELTNVMNKHVDKYNNNDKFHFVAYNSPFDNKMLRAFWNKCKDKFFGSYFWVPDICVMRMAGLALRNNRSLYPNFKLATLLPTFGIEINGELHDANTDIAVTFEIYKQLTNGVTNG